MNTKCILVADGVRARFFAYNPTVARETGQQLRGLGVRALIVVADPRMLGVLRPALETVLHPEPVELQSLARELSTLSVMELEEHLRHAGLLPAPTTHVAPRL